jgi:Xaa-Pro aminopeptidase
LIRPIRVKRERVVEDLQRVKSSQEIKKIKKSVSIAESVGRDLERSAHRWIRS